jgi:hypothetical protein
MMNLDEPQVQTNLRTGVMDRLTGMLGRNHQILDSSYWCGSSLCSKTDFTVLGA